MNVLYLDILGDILIYSFVTSVTQVYELCIRFQSFVFNWLKVKKGESFFLIGGKI